VDLRDTPAYQRFRGEVRAFLGEHWPPAGEEAALPGSERAVRFRQRAIRAGYLARSIPRRYGGSERPPDVLEAAIIHEEFARAGAPGEATGLGPSLLVPTLLEHGSEWQRQRFVEPTILGRLVWCQGYSEPGSGSDLASLQTRAELADGEWVIHGQKIWTSSAHRADLMFCLCRTEPDAGKHAGISYLLLDMKQPGVRVRPLRMMTGESHFNEVFLDGARTPEDWIVGRRGEGWRVSRSTLRHERNMIGNARQTLHLFEALVGLARGARPGGRSALADASVRQRLAALEGRVRAHQYSGYRQLSAAARGRSPGTIALMNKLVGTRLGQDIARLALDLLGDDGLSAPESRGTTLLGTVPDRERLWVTWTLASLGAAIAGGTANIQRNIIAERGLGLPRDAFAAGARRDR
jgi:alkylation response protein AidB-like acyl-CoA dehydrogenase